MSTAWREFARKLARSRNGCIAGALIGVTTGLTLLWLPLAHPLATLSYQLPFNHLPKTAHIPDDAVIVYLDEPSHMALNQPSHEPWDRSLHAALLQNLTAAGSRAVVFDIVFLGPGPDPAADEEFAAAIREHGNVVLAAEAVRFEESGAIYEQLLLPYAPFRDAAASWGLVDLAIEWPERTVRRHLHHFGKDLRSLSWRAAEAGQPRGAAHPAPPERPRWLRYYGPPGSLPSTSFYQALEPDGTPPEFFRDRVVFVGAKPATGFTGTAMDEFATPFFPWAQQIAGGDGSGRLRPVFAPGVEIHATSFLNLVRDDWLRQLPVAWELLLVSIVGAAFGFFLVPLRPSVAAAVALPSAAGIAIFAWLLFWNRDIWFAWTIPIAQIVTILGWAILYNSMQWYVERRLMAQTLSLHLSPARAKVVMGKPELLRPGAEMQTVSILFSDIVGFSGIAEKMPPNDLADFLNRYFETAISSIHQHEGTIVKLIGDAIFAIWNAPEEQANHAARACNAALFLRDRLVEFSQSHRSFPSLRTRIGLHTGQACVGNFGSSTRFDYTAIGDAVNVAARLEGLNRFLDTDVLATCDIVAEVSTQIRTRFAGSFVLKGLERSIPVYELLDDSPGNAASQPWRAAFDRALRAFRTRDFQTARRFFEDTLEDRPSDGPSGFYLEWLETNPPASLKPGWRGEIVLSEK